MSFMAERDFEIYAMSMLHCLWYSTHLIRDVMDGCQMSIRQHLTAFVIIRLFNTMHAHK